MIKIKNNLKNILVKATIAYNTNLLNKVIMKRFYFKKYFCILSILMASVFGSSNVMGEDNLTYFEFTSSGAYFTSSVSGAKDIVLTNPATIPATGTLSGGNPGGYLNGMKRASGNQNNTYVLEIPVKTTRYSSLKLSWDMRFSSAANVSQATVAIDGKIGTGSYSSIETATGYNKPNTNGFISVPVPPESLVLGQSYENQDSITINLTITVLGTSTQTIGIDNVKIVGTATSSAPPTLTTQAVSNITTTTATGNGTITALGNGVTSSGICWKTSTGPTTANSKTTNGPTTATSYTGSMTGLTANTIYYVKAYAIGSGGTGYGGEVSFTTLPNAPTIASGSNVTRNSFTANWNAPVSQGSASYTYTVQVTATSGNYSTLAFTQAGIASGTLLQAVTGLTASTTYYYRVIAVNAAGSSTYSAEGAVTTTAVCPAPVILSQPSSFAVNQNGTASLTLTASGTGLFYQWYSSPNANGSNSTAITGATLASYNAPTTTVGTTYFYCIISSTCSTSVTSNVVSVQINIPVFSGNNLCIEAENFAPTSNLSPMQVVSNSLASNGQFVIMSKTVDGDHGGSYLSPTASDGILKYNFKLNQSTTIYPWLRVICPSTSSDSYWYRIDNNTTWLQWHTPINPQTSDTLMWQPLNAILQNDGGYKIMGINMSGGDHTIEITYREKGTTIDKILLTDCANGVPFGKGCGLINHSPIVTQLIPPQNLIQNSTEIEIDVSSHFSDPDCNDNLTFSYSCPTSTPFVTIADNILKINPTIAGVYPITVKATDTHGAQVSTTFTLTVQPASNVPFTVSIQVPATKVCANTQLPLTSVVTGGNGSTFSYLWQSTGATFNCSTCRNPIATIHNDATIILTVTQGSQTVTDSISIKVAADFNVIAPTTICKGQLVQLNTSKDNEKYYWSPIYMFSCQACSNPTIEDLAQTMQFQVSSETYYGGCVNTKTFTINVEDYPNLDPETVQLKICNGNSVPMNITLNNPSNYSFNWSPSTNVSSTTVLNPILSPNVSTMYTLTASSQHGCSVSKNIYVRSINITDSIPSVYTIEKGTDLTINHPGFDDITWSSKTYITSKRNAFTVFKPDVSIDDTLTMWLDGCSHDKSIRINVVETPKGSFTYNAIGGLSIHFNAVITSTSYFWDFGDGQTGSEQSERSPNHTFPKEGAYNVCLTQTGTGYSVTSCQIVHVKEIKGENCCH